MESINHTIFFKINIPIYWQNVILQASFMALNKLKSNLL